MSPEKSRTCIPQRSLCKSCGTAPLSGGGPLIHAQNFGKIEHIHQIMQLYQSCFAGESIETFPLCHSDGPDPEENSL